MAISTPAHGSAYTAYPAPYPLLPPTGSVTPSSGSGTSQSFTFHASDANGYRYIQQIQTLISPVLDGANGCQLLYYPDWNGLYIWTAGNWLGPANPGSPGTLSNPQCTVDAGASSVSGSGNDLSLTAAIQFASTYTGVMNTYFLAYDHASQSLGWQTVGTWTVPPPPGGNITATYTYDALGRLHTVTDTANGTATYTYDAVGNLLSISR